MELKILVGTMTGTAEMVAEEMSDTLAELGHSVDVEAMDDLDISIFDGGGDFLIVTSTYGQGDVPDNAMTLYNGLTERKPDLNDIRYGVFSMGDMTYSDTFNYGGKKFDKALQDCGARRVGEIFCHDASSGSIPEDDGVDWVKDWIRNHKDDRVLAA
ncbi:MAG: flavodoxin domain-containing protein [Rhodospirillaceae bacterium]|nr:flavodoxin domain-containing protein [Rhodospirillaceae bacterium]MCY4237042.1 flavodoxin domain-containing protein [Rhodospirillaceae bacterium]